MKAKTAEAPFTLNFITAADYAKQRENIVRIPTGTLIDELCGGGIEQGEVAEFYGEWGSGKTQICNTLAVNIAGRGSQVLDIDTEETFKPDRIKQIAKARGLSIETVCENILLAQPFTSKEQTAVLAHVPETFHPKLIIVDSLTALFRFDYLGRGMLAERQGLLRQFIHALRNYARLNEAATVVTNQVYGSPDATPFLPLEYKELAVGGHTVYHSIDLRFFLRKGKGNTRIAKLVDSCMYPQAERPFRISERGIEDVETREEQEKTT